MVLIGFHSGSASYHLSVPPMTVMSVTGLLIADLAVCGRVKFKKTWKNPEAQPTSWQGQRIAAFVITFERAVRQGAEITLARELTERGAVGIAGHTLVPLEVFRKDPEGARRTLESEGITGAAVMRVVSSDQEVSYSPGSAHYVGGFDPTFWGYWGYGVATLYTPGHTTANQVVFIETRLYSVTDNQMLWAGTSKTTNPKNLEKFINQLCDAVGKKVRKAGLVTR